VIGQTQSAHHSADAIEHLGQIAAGLPLTKTAVTKKAKSGDRRGWPSRMAARAARPGCAGRSSGGKLPGIGGFNSSPIICKPVLKL
jgi:hypothetical protein